MLRVIAKTTFLAAVSLMSAACGSDSNDQSKGTPSGGSGGSGGGGAPGGTGGSTATGGTGAVSTSGGGSAGTPASQELLDPAKHWKPIGAFKVPQSAAGNSTGFAPGVIALRKEGSEKRLVLDTHIYTQGNLYEVAIPSQISLVDPLTDVPIAKEWNQDLYAGIKPAGIVLSARMDPISQSFVFTGGVQYNTESKDAPTVSLTKLDTSGSVTPIGERSVLVDGNNLWSRGGTLRVPDAFAKAHFGGNSLGVGFGAYYSIIAGGSWGPTITVVSEDFAQQKTILGYPDTKSQRAPRPNDYWMGSPGWLGTDPAGEAGTWTGADEIGGENYGSIGLWFDEPAFRGVVFGASQGTGRIGYDAGAITSEGRQDRLYVYDPDDLALVASGTKEMWEPTPKIYEFTNCASGYGGRAAGAAYDADDKRLYVVFVMAYKSGCCESYPIVCVYDVSGS